VTWLVRFGDPTWQQQLQQWARDFKFRATLAPRLDREEEKWHASQPVAPTPVVVQEPPNDEIQTGKSRLLGGAMRISAPWATPELGYNDPRERD
jgi:hypothetical protein